MHGIRWTGRKEFQIWTGLGILVVSLPRNRERAYEPDDEHAR